MATSVREVNETKKNIDQRSQNGAVRTAIWGTPIDKPLTYVVPDEFTLVNRLTDTALTISEGMGNVAFKNSGLPFEGDLARTLEDWKSNWYIRIDGEWVNIHGTCDGDVQPVVGTVSKPGKSFCLAKADHRHGIADSWGYWDTCTELNENGKQITVDYWREWPEGTLSYIAGRGYIRCNEEWVCFTHIH